MWEDLPVLEVRDICIYIYLIHFIVQQKLIQHCKAIIFQFKKHILNETSSQRGLWTV